MASFLLAPSAIAQQGSAPPRGFFAASSFDVLGYCGGLCWTYYVFVPGGMVHLGIPHGGVDYVDCSRRPTFTDGSPRCVPFRIASGQIQIGDRDPQAFAWTGRDLMLGRQKFARIEKLDGLRLDGAYGSSTYVRTDSGVTGSNIGTDVGMRFRRDGTFEGRQFAQVHSETSSGTASGYGERNTRGRYRITGNTLELRFADGVVRRLTIFLPFGRGKGPMPEVIHIEHRDYVLQKR